MARFPAIQVFSAVALISTVAAADAQGFDLRSLFSFGGTTGTVDPGPAATPSTPGTPEWSGEPGASGHPAMTAEAIRAAAANFPQCLESLWPLAARRKVSREVFEANVRGLDARPADHGPARCPARVHQAAMGLPRYAGQRAAHRRRSRHPGQASRSVRCGREGLWRGPPRRGGDLGHRVRTTAGKSAIAR